MEVVTKRLLSTILITGFFALSAEAKDPVVVKGGDDTIPELDCVIEPSEIVDVGSAVPGLVESIYAYRSDLVKKGEVIVEFESSVEQGSLELAKLRAGLNTAIELRQESAAFGYLTQNRNQALFKKSAISVHDMDRLKTETRIARLQVIQEKDNKRIAGLEYRRAQAILQQRTIRSPVDGVVMERFKSVGEYVDDEPVLRVAQLDPLHVEVIVPVDYMGRIVQGMQANVTPGLTGSETHLATVERVDRVADAASGTYGVRLSLSNPEYKIPTGLRCNLTFMPRESQEHEEIASNIGAVSANESDKGGQVDEQLVVPLTLESNTSVVELETPVVEPSEPLQACYSIGPVANKTLARKLSAKLADQSDAKVIRTETGQIVNNYLVLAAPQPDHQASKQLVARLDKAGITDRFLLTRGRYKGRVSLGFFGASHSASRYQKMLASKGFEAEIVMHATATKLYWLDVSLQAGAGLSDQVEEITASLPATASFNPLTCSTQLVQR